MSYCHRFVVELMVIAANRIEKMCRLDETINKYSPSFLLKFAAVNIVYSNALLKSYILGWLKGLRTYNQRNHSIIGENIFMRVL